MIAYIYCLFIFTPNLSVFKLVLLPLKSHLLPCYMLNLIYAIIGNSPCLCNIVSVVPLLISYFVLKSHLLSLN